MSSLYRVWLTCISVVTTLYSHQSRLIEIELGRYVRSPHFYNLNFCRSRNSELGEHFIGLGERLGLALRGNPHHP